MKTLGWGREAGEKRHRVKFVSLEMPFIAPMSYGWQSVLCQCQTAAALMCQTLAQGMAQGWSSPGVHKLKNNQGPFKPTDDEVSWIVSLFELGLLVGSVVSCMAMSLITLCKYEMGGGAVGHFFFSRLQYSDQT